MTTENQLAMVRKFILDTFVARASPPPVEEIMAHFRITRREATDALHQLEVQRQIHLLPGTERILMAFPFSAIATPFRVTVKGGMSYFANCAWDAIAFHPMLGKDVGIDGRCYHCGEGVTFALKEGSTVSATGEAPLVYIGLPASDWWEDIIRTCSNSMVFFRSSEHFREWRSSEGTPAGEVLSVAIVLAMSQPIYGGKLETSYQRPSKETVQATFKSLGLTSTFWDL